MRSMIFISDEETQRKQIQMTQTSGYFQKNVSGYRITVCITANDPEGPYTANMYMNGADMEATGKTAKFKTLKGAEKTALKWIQKYASL
jgi:hypothetical protein